MNSYVGMTVVKTDKIISVNKAYMVLLTFTSLISLKRFYYFSHLPASFP